MQKPSNAAAHKARLSAAFKLVRADSQYFRVVSIRRHRVTILFAGEEIVFSMREGELVASLSRFMTAEDYATLFIFAKQLMSARVQGDVDAKNDRRRKKSDIQKSEQLALFSPAELPIAR